MLFPFEKPFDNLVGDCPGCGKGKLRYYGTYYRTDCCRYELASLFFESSEHYWAHKHGEMYFPGRLQIPVPKDVPVHTNYPLPLPTLPAVPAFDQLALFDINPLGHITQLGAWEAACHTSNPKTMNL